MELLFEILAECAIDLITDGGIEVMTGSEESRKWSKGVKTALVISTLLIFAAVIAALLYWGVSFLIDEQILLGIVFAALGTLFSVLAVAKFRKTYKKRKMIRDHSE